MKKIKLGVIYGGLSTEHEVSINSAKSVIDNLDKDKYDIYKIYIDKKENHIMYIEYSTLFNISNNNKFSSLK